ncbi:peptidyl-prolyl cis-trans isomerase [Konateibacter massiliensis]|uniref:peptidyl-prolyl cis-trans isomerase n=1 Tax=Konateibacter massiliensis TaxID=2002841 RepID=UPI0015D50DFD|nr:peptidyl-prolyl cis-trans isomerase [Konateibacter massiliensis]
MKKSVSKRIVGMAAAVLACASLVTGCGSVDLNKPVSVVNDENIPFGVAKFYAKNQQVIYESYYGSLFGDNMWNQALSEDMTFGESTLQSILEDLQEMYLVNQHAEEYGITLTDAEIGLIEDTAKQFMEDNDKEAQEAMGASEAIIKEYLTKYTLQTKIAAAIRAGADTEVADEDAAQRTFGYVYISTAGSTDESGNTVELTDEEKAEKKAEAQAIVDAVAGGTDFETAVTDTERKVSSASYGKDDDAGMDEAVIAAADALQEGETSAVIELDSGYYIVNLTSAYDEEQTEARRAEIISERQDTLYDDTYAAWLEAATITVDDQLWKKINFDESVSIATDTTTEDTTTTGDTTTEDTTTTDDSTATDAEADTTTAE